MLANRWRVVWLFAACVSLGLALNLGAQELFPDLRVAQVSLAPADAVSSGESVTATVIVERSGPPLAADATVDITWRRRDREEPCGTSLGVFPAGDGPLALQFVAVIPTGGLAPGAYEVIATADPAGLVPEASESNNRLAAPLEILPPKPELHPVRVDVTPTPPLAWGETAALTAGVMNTGGATAGPFNVSFAAFPVYCVDRTTGERWTIAPSGTVNARGVREWLFTPDPDGSSSPQIAGLASLVLSLPDDAWIGFDAEHVAGLEQAGRADATAVFPTGLPLRQLLTSAGSAGGIGLSKMAPLSADQAARLESCVSTYAIRVRVDDAFGADDEDPTNNALDLSLSVEPSLLELADLVPISASFSRAMPLNWDDDVDVDVVVANRGGGPAPAAGGADVIVKFWIRPLGATTWQEIAARSILQLGIDENTSTDTVDATIDASPGRLNLAPGSYELRIAVDPDDAIPEQDEQNNEILLGFSVQGTELHPVGLEVSSSSIRQGDSIEIVATIENTGERTLDGFSVGFYVGDVRFATFAYRATAASDPGLEEEDRARVKGTLSTEDLVPGVYALRVVADPDNRIPELDESNNQIRATITVLPPAERLAELFLSEVTLAPASPIPAGLPIAARARVRNGGTIDAGRFSVAFVVVRDDGTTMSVGRIDCASGTAGSAGVQACACQPSSGLARGAAQDLEYTLWTAGWPEGRYTLYVRVDPASEASASGEVREQDETNNEMILSFSLGRAASDAISPGANLAVGAVSVEPASAPAGTLSAVLFATIANRGAEAAGTFAVDVRWTRPDGSALSLARSNVEGLGPSQSATLRYELSLGSIGWTCGAHAFQVVVDPAGSVTEASEDDNAATAAFRIDCGPGSSLGPDLAASLSVPAARDGAVLAGCPAAVEVTVVNRGGLASGPFRVELRQNGAVAGIQDASALAPQGTATVRFDLATQAAGTLSLSVLVDSEGRVAEQDETNNAASLALTVAPRDASTAVRAGGPYRGAVGHVVVDSASGTIVAASDDGVLHAFSRGAPPVLLYDASLDDPSRIAGLALDRGTSLRTVTIATASGTLHRFGLATGQRVGNAVSLGSPATCLALDAAGTAYIGTETGLAVVKRTGASVATLALGARVLDVAIDTSGTIAYALTPTAVYAIATNQLAVLCTAGSFGADAAAMALGPSGIYVGTTAGRVIAFAPCTSYGSLGAAMLRSWNVDLSASGGSVTSLAAYAETAADPVYVALCEGGRGRLVGLSLAGRMLWTTEPQAGAGCFAGDLAAQRQRGRVMAVETDGTIRVVGDTGSVLLTEDALASQGKTVRSGVAADSVVRETGGVSKLEELYYVGTSDGSLYVVTVARGGCP